MVLAGRRIGEIPERGDPGQQHLQMISAHVSAYITHVRTQLKQTIPKAIVHCLVSAPAQLSRLTAQESLSTWHPDSSCMHSCVCSGGHWDKSCLQYTQAVCLPECQLANLQLPSIIVPVTCGCADAAILVDTGVVCTGDASQEAASRQVACRGC